MQRRMSALCQERTSVLLVAFWIFNRAAEFVVNRFRGCEAKTHNGITCCGHKVVALFDDFAILAVIEAKFLGRAVDCGALALVLSYNRELDL